MIDAKFQDLNKADIEITSYSWDQVIRIGMQIQLILRGSE